MSNSRFDDIRPYRDDEIPSAMCRIAESESFPLIASYVFPDMPLESAARTVKGYATIREFQHDAMRRVNEQVIARSISELSYSGVDALSPGVPYLFVSNHRDIVLDSCLLQYILVENGLETTEITFGANLMMNPLVIDIGKANKMFRVERPSANIKEFYRSSLHLSEYIRESVTQRGESVWIAQRNGRTKDGKDLTDQGLIKMFCLSERKDKVKALADLNIVPVSVSYEWEPCDVLKALERYDSLAGPYVKKPGEDLNSILTGILSEKGRVHFHVCKPLSATELSALGSEADSEYHRLVAALIDKRINATYRLYPNNYIAHDLLYGDAAFKSMYNEGQRARFLAHMETLAGSGRTDGKRQRDIFLGIYANPIESKGLTESIK